MSSPQIKKTIFFLRLPYPIVKQMRPEKHRTSGGEGFLKVSTHFHHSKLLKCEKNPDPIYKKAFYLIYKRYL
jgi:hypothetical protein